MRSKTVSLGLLLSIALTASHCSGQQAESSSTIVPAKEITQRSWPAGSYVDDAALKAYLHQQGIKLLQREDLVSGEDLKASVSDAPATISLKELVGADADKKLTPRERCYQSTLVFGNLYNCGHCDKEHLSDAGAVALSADGLVLTNYHVIAPESKREIYNFFVMTCEGKVYPVLEVLAASKDDDLALVRVEANDLVPVILADSQPQLMEDLQMVSHPHHRFFTFSEGVVSRYTSRQDRDGSRHRWMQITAPFSQGSSGCGVFDLDGKLTGLVSLKEEIAMKHPSGVSQRLFTVFKAIPLDAINELVTITPPAEPVAEELTR